MRIQVKKRGIEIDGFAALSSLPPDNSFFSCTSEKVYFFKKKKKIQYAFIYKRGGKFRHVIFLHPK